MDESYAGNELSRNPTIDDLVERTRMIVWRDSRANIILSWLCWQLRNAAIRRAIPKDFLILLDTHVNLPDE